MNLFKNRFILFYLIFTSITLSSLLMLSVGFSQSSTSEAFIEESSYNLEILDIQSRMSKNPFSQDFSIFGYRLKVEDSQPIIRDENGLLIFYQDKTTFVDVTLELRWNNFEFKNIPLFGTLYFNKDGCKNFYYQIEDPLKGFFMTLIITAETTYIDLAFDDKFSQYCYNGLASKGYMSFNPYFTQQFEIVQVDVERNTQTISIDNAIQTLKDFQGSSISIYQNDERKEIVTYSGITHTDYGLAHECCDLSIVNLAEDLPDDYWEPFTGIDYGIYRRTPSEAQVKSDLQYYNRDEGIYGDGYSRDVKAYAIYAESNPTRNTEWYIRKYWRWWKGWVYEWLTPSEVTSLWYYDYAGGHWIDVEPYNTIIHATVCYGYSGNDGIPHMAKAFVDYGAEAYVGCTKAVPGIHNDDFTEDFWHDLCQSDRTVYQATISYIDEHNEYVGDYGETREGEDMDIDWIYGTHIKIYGNVNARLAN